MSSMEEIEREGWDTVGRNIAGMRVRRGGAVPAAAGPGEDELTRELNRGQIDRLRSQRMTIAELQAEQQRIEAENALAKAEDERQAREFERQQFHKARLVALRAEAQAAGGDGGGAGMAGLLQMVVSSLQEAQRAQMEAIANQYGALKEAILAANSHPAPSVEAEAERSLRLFEMFGGIYERMHPTPPPQASPEGKTREQLQAEYEHAYRMAQLEVERAKWAQAAAHGDEEKRRADNMERIAMMRQNQAFALLSNNLPKLTNAAAQRILEGPHPQAPEPAAHARPDAAPRAPEGTVVLHPWQCPNCSATNHYREGDPMVATCKSCGLEQPLVDDDPQAAQPSPPPSPPPGGAPSPDGSQETDLVFMLGR